MTQHSSELQRTEAFSDGVFAIAITLLALELKTPMDGDQPLKSGLFQALAHQWPSYVSFVTSFLTILITWINHHRMFEVIHKRDNAFMLLNGLLLMTVTLIPFPTELVAEYILTKDAWLSAAVYSGLFILIAGTFNALWRHAAKGDRLFSEHSDHKVIEHIDKQFRFGPVAYIVTFALSFIAPLASIVGCFALAAFYAIPPKSETA